MTDNPQRCFVCLTPTEETDTPIYEFGQYRRPVLCDNDCCGAVLSNAMRVAKFGLEMTHCSYQDLGKVSGMYLRALNDFEHSHNGIKPIREQNLEEMRDEQQRAGG